ncbi:glutamate racemase [Cohaesibacter marisflavi]|uniref:Glutamate racemase n=1 Tax=Cohaesibacter marisflavi TaxID=655353 RepID=A0A1I5HF74_9HYPH|nr:glutamate racemase [Cohaesibacter marisflavi]
MDQLGTPVGIFDAGIGSFGIVETVKKHYPNQDIIWFADRASFPLGKKTPDQLFETGRKSVSFLQSHGAQKVIVAANVLSMVVMERLQEAFPELELYGVTPPVRRAAEYGNFCILGVEAMVTDPKLREFVERLKPSSLKASFANASPLIDELVETGIFVSDPDRTEARVRDYMSNLTPQQMGVAAYTLSSTHLPWLRFAFERACPDKVFLDPAEELVLEMRLPNDGSGQITAFTTENIDLSMTQPELKKMLDLIGYSHIEPNIVPQTE